MSTLEPVAGAMAIHPLLDPARRCAPAEAPDGPGLHALFLRDGAVVDGLDPVADGLLYVGKSGRLNGRDHFTVRHSGFSSPRRSLGALLKGRLGLSARPRDRSGRHFANFRFTDAGETALSRWMETHLALSVLATARAGEAERDAIRGLEPPLNLTGWPNPRGASIKERRGVCAREARDWWVRHGDGGR